MTDKKVEKEEDHTWHPQQSKLLKSWAEVSSSYRWMHNQAYMSYRKKNLLFMIPLIIMSTVTGTANFAQNTFPEVIRPNVPQIIGAINLISAILTTIYQFLKISEFMESHRISSINYGKLARTITVELNLPVRDRSTGGAECVKTSRTEIDRLIEQSPSIPKHILVTYENNFAGQGLSEPEIVVINKVDIFEDVDNATAVTVADAALKLKNLTKKPFTILSNASPTTKKNEEVKNEIRSLNGKFTSIVDELKSKVPSSPSKNFGFFNKKVQQPVIEPPPTIIIERPPVINENIEQPVVNETTSVNTEVELTINNENDQQITPSSDSDLDILRKSKLVSSFKM
jgi:hypothetical protein